MVFVFLFLTSFSMIISSCIHAGCKWHHFILFFFYYGLVVFHCTYVPYLLYPGISMLTFDDSVLAVARWFPQLTSASVPGVWSLCEHLPMEVALLCHQKGRAPWAGSPPAPPYPALWNPPVCSPASPSPVLPPLEPAPYSPFTSSHTLALVLCSS